MLITDAKTWNIIIANKEGYIFNDFGTQFPGSAPNWNTKNNNKLHKTSCLSIKQMSYQSDGKNNKHHFSSKPEAIEWLNANRRDCYTICSNVTVICSQS